VKVDVPRSEVTIGDRRFPAVALLCPPAPEQPEPAKERVLGEPVRAKYPCVYVPCENGVLIQLQKEDKGVTVMLDARTCELDEWRVAGPNAGPDKLWLPQPVCILAGKVGKWLDRRGLLAGPWHWDSADEWWVVEHIDRVSVMPYTEPEGPPVRLMRLGERP